MLLKCKDLIKKLEDYKDYQVYIKDANGNESLIHNVSVKDDMCSDCKEIHKKIFLNV